MHVSCLCCHSPFSQTLCYSRNKFFQDILHPEWSETGVPMCSPVSPYKSWFAGLMVSRIWALIRFWLRFRRKEQCRSVVLSYLCSRLEACFKLQNWTSLECNATLSNFSSRLCFLVLNEGSIFLSVLSANGRCSMGNKYNVFNFGNWIEVVNSTWFVSHSLF